jgi:hypothetical protein
MGRYNSLALDPVKGTSSSNSLLCKEPAAGKSGRATVGGFSSPLAFHVFSYLNYPCCGFGEGHIFESFYSAKSLWLAEAKAGTTGGLASALARSVFHYLGTPFSCLGFGNGHVSEPLIHCAKSLPLTEPLAPLIHCAKSLPLTEPDAKTVSELLMTS